MPLIMHACPLAALPHVWTLLHYYGWCRRWILGFCFTKWTESTFNTTHAALNLNWRLWVLDILVLALLLLFSLAVVLFFCQQNRLKVLVRLDVVCAG
jgi:hypothetical protein